MPRKAAASMLPAEKASSRGSGRARQRSGVAAIPAAPAMAPMLPRLARPSTASVDMADCVLENQYLALGFQHRAGHGVRLGRGDSILQLVGRVTTVGQIQRADVSGGALLDGAVEQLGRGDVLRLELLAAGFLEGEVAGLVAEQHLNLGALALHLVGEDEGDALGHRAGRVEDEGGGLRLGVGGGEGEQAGDGEEGLFHGDPWGRLKVRRCEGRRSTLPWPGWPAAWGLRG